MGAVSIKIDRDRDIVMHHRDEGSDLPIIHQIWSARVYDLSHLRRWPDLVQELAAIHAQGKRPLVIDAGANIGASALFFATFLTNAHVLALEPEATNYDLLHLNSTALATVQCVKGALTARGGAVGVFDPGLGAVGFRTSATTATDLGTWTADVSSFSVSQLLHMAPDDTVPFAIKIDIEGGENDLFSRNTAWIDSFPLIIIELHDWMLPGSANSKNFLCAIAASGRDFVQLGENIFSIRN